MTSDYVPLCLSTGERERRRNKLFYLQKMSLISDEIEDVITQCWNMPIRETDVARVIIRKLGRLKRL